MAGLSDQSNLIFFPLIRINILCCKCVCGGVVLGNWTQGPLTHILDKCSYHWAISLALKFCCFIKSIRNRQFGVFKKDFGLFWVPCSLLRSRLPTRLWPVCCGWQAELHPLSLPFPLCAQRGWLCQDEDHHSAQAAPRVLGLPLSCAHPRRSTVWAAEPPDCHMRGCHEARLHRICPSLALWLR